MEIKADFTRIIIAAANRTPSPLHLPGLVRLLNACLEGDISLLTSLARDERPAVQEAARYILTKHNFNLLYDEDLTAHSLAPISTHNLSNLPTQIRIKHGLRKTHY